MTNARFAVYALVVLPLSALRGWVLSVLWGWFVVPLGVVAIGVWEGAGLAVFTTFLISWRRSTNTMSEVERKASPEAKIVADICHAVIVALLSLGLGGIYHLLAS